MDASGIDVTRAKPDDRMRDIWSGAREKGEKEECGVEHNWKLSLD